MSQLLLPQIDEVSRPYWEGALAGELRLQRCADCGTVWHPPQYTCPGCMSFDTVWFPAKGSGSVDSFTIVRHSVHPATDGQVPYAVILVRLEEGPLVVSGIRECDFDDLQVGQRVEAVFEQVADGVALPYFRPQR